MLSDLSKKNVSVGSIAKKIVEDNKLLNEVLDNVDSDKAVVKYNSLNVLRFLSEKHPDVLYPEWNFFVKLLDNDNTFLRTIGLTIIANLSTIDTDQKFEETFNKYYGLLEDASMINAANVVASSGIIAKAKPQLQSKITKELLRIDKTHHSSECKNIIKGKAILTFEEYFDECREKKKIIQFVRNELKNTRSATSKKAEKFLKKWDKCVKNSKKN